jgi:hypothetical protein
MEIYVISPNAIFLQQRKKLQPKHAILQHATHIASPMPDEISALVKITETTF